MLAVYYYKKQSKHEKRLHGESKKLTLMYFWLFEAYFAQQEYKNAKYYLQQVLKTQHTDKMPQEISSRMIVDMYNTLGFIYKQEDKPKKALKEHYKALCVQNQILPENDWEFLDTYRYLATNYIKMEEPTKAIDYFNKAIDIATCSKTNYCLGSLYFCLGEAFYQKGDYDQAIACCEKSLLILKQEKNVNYLDLANIYDGLGKVYMEKEMYQTAFSYYEKRLAIETKHLPPHHIKLASAYNALASVYTEEANLEKATFYLQKVLENQLHNLGLYHVSLVETYDHLIQMYLGMENWEEVISHSVQVVGILEHLYGENHSSLIHYFSLLGSMHEICGTYDQAILCYEKKLKICLKNNSKASAIRSTYKTLGDLCWKQHNYAQAMEYYPKILKHKENPPLKKEHLIYLYEKMGNGYAQLGLVKKAVTCYKTAYPIAKKHFGIQHLATRSLKARLELIEDNMLM